MCLIFESLRCPIDFLKRQYRVNITYPLISFMIFRSFSENSQVSENYLLDVILSLRYARALFATSKPIINEHLLFKFFSAISLPETLPYNNA